MTSSLHRKSKKLSPGKALSSTGNDYCQNTTVHGFAYWVSPDCHPVEKVFWIVIVIIGFTAGAIIVSKAIISWNEKPKKVEISSFSEPVTKLIYPAITVCKPNAFDSGEYVRAVFNNFQYKVDKSETEYLDYILNVANDVNCNDTFVCDTTELLRKHYELMITGGVMSSLIIHFDLITYFFSIACVLHHGHPGVEDQGGDQVGRRGRSQHAQGTADSLRVAAQGHQIHHRAWRIPCCLHDKRW